MATFEVNMVVNRLTMTVPLERVVTFGAAICMSDKLILGRLGKQAIRNDFSQAREDVKAVGIHL